MKKIVLLMFTAIIAVACGDTAPTIETYSVSGSITIEDPESWIDSQTVMVGLFVDDAIVPAYSMSITKPDNDNNIPFSFDNIDGGNYYCKVYVAESGIYRVAIHQYSEVSVAENIELSHATVQLLTFDRVQDQLFSKCIQCHGASSAELAAGLDFTEGNSYDNLVGVQSTNSDKLRVASGDASSSYLVQVLNQEDLPFDHPSSTSAKASDIELVEIWIDNGALDN